ncbi:MAG TPA: hypothetical protein ENK26_07195 [Gammaproteobacteria bacterium]|nr:hypothetical protein [Gammaproteobacteria bacterium]
MNFILSLLQKIASLFGGRPANDATVQNETPEDVVTNRDEAPGDPGPPEPIPEPETDSWRDSTELRASEGENSPPPASPDFEEDPGIRADQEAFSTPAAGQAPAADSVALDAISLKSLFPGISEQTANAIVAEINHNLERYKLNTINRQSHFFAQIRQETGPGMRLEESFNYPVSTLKRLFSVFREHPEMAEKYGRTKTRRANQKAIANIVYDDQYRDRSHKLGNIHPGDGWRYRGRGLLMITGRYNYRRFTHHHRQYWADDPIDFEAKPEKLAEPGIALRSAVYFWLDNRLYLDADRGEGKSLEFNLKIVKEITRKIQGSALSAPERQQHYRKMATLLTKSEHETA